MAISARTNLTTDVSGVFPSSPVDTASVNVTAGDWVEIVVMTFTAAGAATAVSGLGVTWTSIRERQNPGRQFIRAWGGFVPSTTSGTISITCSGVAEIAWTVGIRTGVDTSTPIVTANTADNAGTGTGPTLAMTDRTGAGNVRQFATGSGQNSGTTATAGTGYDERVDYATAALSNFLYLADGTTDTDPASTLSNSPSEGWAIIGWELQEAGGGGDPTEALTGSGASISGATGSFGILDSLALAGAAAAIAAAIGSLGVGDSVTLTGNEALLATAIGSVGVQSIVELAGANAGIAGAVGGFSFDAALSGANAGVTTASGTLGPAVSTPITGQDASIATASGTLPPGVSLVISGAGASIAAAAGTIGGSVSANPQLVIGDPTSFIGYSMVGPSDGVAVSGAGANISTAAGSFLVGDALGLTGANAGIAGTVGTLGAGISLALTGAGAAIAGAVGSLGASGDPQLQGVGASIATAAGLFQLEQLSGANANINALAGSFPGIPVGLSGAGAGILTETGTLGVGFSTGLTGAGASLLAQAGTFSTGGSLTLSGLGAGIVTAAGTLVALSAVDVRIGSVSTTSALSFGSVNVSTPGGVSIGKVTSN